jgi:hypothetical protein
MVEEEKEEEELHMYLARGVGRRCRSGCWSPASVGSRESGHGCVHMSLLPPFYVFLLPHPPSQEQQGHPPAHHMEGRCH